MVAVDARTARRRFRHLKILPSKGKPLEYIPLEWWGEHCVECGMPACYETCGKYVPDNGGYCRRFVHGLEPVRLKGGGLGCAVAFKPWGKLELHYTGRVVANKVCSHWFFLDRLAWHFIAIANRTIFACSPSMRRYLTNGYILHRNARLRRVHTKPYCVRKWSIECFAEHDECLHCAVMMPGRGEVLVQSICLRPGNNLFSFDIPAITGEAYFRIFSIDGSHGEVVFTRLDLVGSIVSPAQFVKCIAWDLDNTLWRGTLVDVGDSGVHIRPEAVSLLHELDKRGIMNTICSKNDFEPAMKVLRAHGLAEYFVFPKINWNPKSENLKQIAKEMNIGLDSFAFIDDSVHERGEVADNLPMIRVFDESCVSLLATMPCFNPPQSKESSSRRLSYLAEMERRGDEVSFDGDHEAFLRSCQIELTLAALQTPDVRKRCWELVNRTNQLTLAGRRYDESGFDTLVSTNECWAISCRDKYGDYGVVGFIAVGTNGRVVEFVMSCRVACKKCEQSVLVAIARRMRERGVTELRTEVIKTDRNGAIVAAFDAMPVERNEENGRITYVIKTDGEGKSLFVNRTRFSEDVAEH